MSLQFFSAINAPWEFDQFPDWLSEQQLRAHYEQNYINYIKKLNDLANKHSEIQNQGKLGLILSYSEGEIYNNAAQAWNHEFFWNCFTPNYKGPSKAVSLFLDQYFGSVDNFRKLFSAKSKDHFGSGWCWLIWDRNLCCARILDSSDAYNPISEGYIPLLNLDLWEHAYYIHYQADRKSYIQNFWKYVNWSWLEKQLNDYVF